MAVFVSTTKDSKLKRMREQESAIADALSLPNLKDGVSRAKSMKKLIINYILSRLRETSTIRNLVRFLCAIFTAIGITLSEQQQLHILTAGLLISSMIGVFFPDNVSKAEPEPKPEPKPEPELEIPFGDH